MTLLRHTFAGWTSGATITTGGTGSGDAFSAVVQPTGGSITADTAHPGSVGTQSGKLAYVAGQSVTGYVELALPAAADRVVAQMEWICTAAPAAIDRALSIRSSTGQMVGFYVSTAGKLVGQNAAGAALAGSPTYPTFTVGHLYRLDAAATRGTGTSDGRIEFSIYDVTAAAAVMTYDSATNNTGTAQGIKAQFGRYQAVSQAWTQWIATPAIADYAAGFIAAPSASTDATVTMLPAAVTVAAPAPTVTAGGGATVAMAPAAVQVSASAIDVVAETVITTSGPPTITVTAPAPVVTAGATTALTPAAVTASAPSLTVTAGATVQMAPASIAVAARVSAVSTGVSAVMAPAAITVAAPGLTVSTGGSITVSMAPAGVTVAARAPVVSAAARLDMLAALILVAARTPTVTTGGASPVIPSVRTLTAATQVRTLTLTAPTRTLTIVEDP